MSFRLIVLIVFCGLMAARAAAYSFTGTRWTSTSATMHLQLGPSSGPLADGAASWGASAEDALALWNSQLRGFRFNVVRDSTATKAQGNRASNVHFSGDIYGEAWGNGVLAVTLTYSSGTANTETDVLFNQRLNWDSYRGPLRFNASGQPVYDFHRVALHEFGHALGLDHPDEAGQSVPALMNSRINSLDALTTDDISGAQTLYGAAVATTTSSPTSTPPVITTQPANVTITAGQPASFTVQATGTPPLTFQWLKSGAPIAGANASSYAIAVASSADAGSYAVRVSNTAGTVTSTSATLVVNAAPAPTVASAPPAITSQPVGRTVAIGGSVTLSVGATGSAPLAYQWRKDGVAIAGANASVYRLDAATAAHAGSYVVVVSNAAGSVTSTPAQIIVGAAPTIVAPPVGQAIAAGTGFRLTVAVSGSPAPTFQWFKDGRAIAGATGASHGVASADAAHAGVYHVVASNILGSATSASATISLQTTPAITSQPVAQTVKAGERAQFSVTTAAAPATSFQWLRNGSEISGATAAELVLEAVAPADAGIYSVRVTNAFGSTVSADARLTVNFSRIVNLSTRGFVPAGGALTPGFFVRGASAKPLLIRAVGPTLSTFGVGTALGEAKLDVIAQESSAIIASNSDWAAAPELSNAFARVGAFPLAAGSKDAAVQTELAPAGYTVRIAPTDPEMSGVTLAEIYDADAHDAGSQLVNVSTLGSVGTGEHVLTAGFVISGNAPKRVLIRAVGPGLAPFGVSDLLGDPQLGLVPLGSSEPLATNDDWPDLPHVRAAFASAGAFALPAGSKDAALVITLEPGAYTVVVSGVDGIAAGNALVEIYDLEP